MMKFSFAFIVTIFRNYPYCKFISSARAAEWVFSEILRQRSLKSTE